MYPNKNKTEYRISYTLNGIRKHKPLGLEYNERNKVKAESAKKKFDMLEKENKRKIKYGAIVLSKDKVSLKLSDASSSYLDSIKKNINGKQDYHSRTFEVTIRQFLKLLTRTDG
ncbi:MAG: hypothetical protein IPN57_00190 [Ignavibacteria bacterium]|nr:hypothetical protein [Ignavibacteria bacterium]